MKVKRLYVEKKPGFDIEAQALLNDFKTNLGIMEIDKIRLLNRYDISSIDSEAYETAKNTIFSEPPVDFSYDEDFTYDKEDRIFGVEYLPGQYDQRADSAAQCVQILTHGVKSEVKTAKIVVIKGSITDSEYQKIKDYYINAIDSREANLRKVDTLDVSYKMPEDVEIISNFIDMSKEQLEDFLNSKGLAMSNLDLAFCQEYFKNVEKRNPSITEIRVIDTYWSDHCRHTTFLTEIENVEIEQGKYSKLYEEAYQNYLKTRATLYAGKDKPVCLMDLAIIGMKELRKAGKLDDMEESEENNACSIVVNVDVDGKAEEWLVMFKNETHNHPTEIEPFGGAATCLGGAIRDPLSGRAYVYQAMRVTGSGNPKKSLAETLPGKLPQRKITLGAAHGYSSYGNQIGLATGQVTEIYDEGYVAKRMEIGAVIAAVPKENVKRESSDPGDIIILLGGRTGRDGCGGATGSSKEHNEQSIETCGAEVQKGNPPTERKIQRLFRNADISKLIKKCNDFGAGGVAVAIGELADGLSIDLNSVPKKYEGLDGTELAISESQERMAVVIDKADRDKFINYAHEENLEAVEVALVTSDNRLRMTWRDKEIVNISRDFLNTNGVRQKTNVFVKMPKAEGYLTNSNIGNIKNKWFETIQDLNVCSQKGLVERFDSTIGANTVLMPFGGKYQLSPSECMASKIPLLKGETTTGTLMSFGYDPNLSKWSPFHGAIYSVVEAVSKIVACGGDYKKVRLSCQEYFEKLGKDSVKWGAPFASLLGAYYAQYKLSIPSIGGKDSMSGTFNDLSVPPTLVAFGVDVVNTANVISAEFKEANNNVILIKCNKTEEDIPDFDELMKNYDAIHELIVKGKVKSASVIKKGGVAEAISKASFGNKIGFSFNDLFPTEELFIPDYSSIMLEISEDAEGLLKDINHLIIGKTTFDSKIIIKGENETVEIEIDELIGKWSATLESVFPTNANSPKAILEDGTNYSKACVKPHSGVASIAKPRVFIPVFPGTNCEYDSKRAFENAGGIADLVVLKNLVPSDIEASVAEFEKSIRNSQIIMFPGGFSAGDEPDGSGKFIGAVFRNPRIKEAINDLLYNRDGLILGICNGFQALIKLGLLPYGEITDMKADSPTLTFNTIGRHISKYVNTKVVSSLSPWFANVNLGDTFSIPVSHGEGRFFANDEIIKELLKNGQVATQYVDFSGNPTYNIDFNPNGSVCSIEGITSKDGRILGKMGHSERMGNSVGKNIYGDKDQKIFVSGIQYFM